MNTSPAVEFKAKTETEPTTGREFVRVPKLAKRHCVNLNSFNADRRFSYYTNSDLFPAILGREVSRAGIPSRLFLDSVPDCVSVVSRSFLLTMRIEFRQ